MTSKKSEDVLGGTTLRVYRYIYRHGPVRLHDLQRALGFSSSSIAEYHVQKLLRLGLLRPAEREAGYVVDRLVFENMLRIRRTIIPIWTTFVVFFACSLVAVTVILNSASSHIYSITVIAVALVVSVYEALRSIEKSI